MVIQHVLCRTRSETPKIVFLAHMIKEDEMGSICLSMLSCRLADASQPSMVKLLPLQYIKNMIQCLVMRNDGTMAQRQRIHSAIRLFCWMSTYHRGAYMCKIKEYALVDGESARVVHMGMQG